LQLFFSLFQALVVRAQWFRVRELNLDFFILHSYSGVVHDNVRIDVGATDDVVRLLGVNCDLILAHDVYMVGEQTLVHRWIL